MLLPGRPAELVLFDPETRWTVEGAKFVSMGKNSAFEGRRLRGRVLATYVNGCCVYCSGDLASRCTGGALSVSQPASSGLLQPHPNAE